MKKINLLLSTSLITINLFSQQAPTGFGTNGVGANANTYWARGGNLFNNAGNNIFGTMWNSPIYFYTDGAQRMVLNGTTGATSGFLGLGTATPTQKLEVDAGNINVATPTNAYMLGSQNILWHKGEVRNLFVGVNAGLNNAGATAFQNTYIGNNAGAANTTGQRNTAVGANAGQSIATGNFNTFIGTEAGRSLTAGNHNTFVGEQAGDLQISGTNNSFFGAHAASGGIGASGIGTNNTILGAFAGDIITNGNANTFTGVNSGGSCNSGSFNTFAGTGSGNNCTAGSRNTMNGWISGLFTTTGNDNVFMGQRAGFFNSTGSNNTYIGVNTGFGFAGATLAGNTATNSAALGNGAQIRRSNVMILGNNDVNVGIGLSNDITTAQGPQNKLEIDAGVNGLNPSPSGAIGTSGLRFRDLHSGNTPEPNPSNSVLSVNTLGDVILVPGGTSGGLGNLCGGTSNPLANNWEIPMAGFNFNYTTPANTQSSFHFGNTVCVPTLGRMNIYNDNLQITSVISSNVSLATNAIGIFSNIVNTGSGNSLAMQGTANTTGTGSSARGVRGEAIAANGNIAEGVKGIASTNNNCQQNIAVGGLAANGTVLSLAGDFDVEQSNSPVNQGVNVEVINGSNVGSTNFGVNAFVRNPGVVNYGGFFSAGSASQNIGVYGDAGGSITGLPASPTQANLAGFFNGDVYISGAFGPSDINLKDNIDTITDALSIIKQLKPKSFDYKHNSYPSMHLPFGKQYGLIAQEVETIIPELVSNNTQPAKLDSVGNVIVPSVNFKGLEYQQLIPFLIKAIQEQQTKIDSLTTKLNSKDSIQDARLTALENAIAACCSNASVRSNNNTNQTTLNQLDVELSDKDAIVLNQNVPNPFAEQTTITYNVPASVGKAQIIFFNNLGQVIQTVDIKTRGKGKVNVFASDLSSGLYNYTLVADGKVIDSKKMVRE